MNISYFFSFFLAGLLTLLTIFFKNYEFLIYAITAIILIVILYTTDKYFKFDQLSVWLFNIWLILHSLGGLAYYQGVRFYDLILFNLVGDPYHILKYDQFVHFYCYVVISILMWRVVHTTIKQSASNVVVCALTILSASGLGALNEIIEFVAVLILNTEGVGGYINTAIDLIANLLGAITGSLYMYAKQ